MAQPEEGKAYDIATQKWVDAPTTTETEAEAAATATPEPDPKKTEEEPLVEKTPEPEVKTPEAAAAKVAEETAPVKKEEAATTDPKKDEIPAWIKEKYGIETQEDLDEVLDSNKKLADELEKERNKKVFASEKEEKLHKFLQDWDLDKIDQGMESAAVLTKLDIQGIDGKKALEEQFILENTELTRDEAKQLFAREYRTKYEAKKSDFDSDEEFEEEKKLREIQMKKDVSRAKKFLEQKQQQLKVKPEEKKPEKATPTVPEEGLKTYQKELKTFFKDFTKFVYKDENGEPLYTIPLDEAKRAKVQEAMAAYVQRPDVYDKNGKIPNFDALELSQTFAEILFGKWMNEERNRQIKVLAQATKAEQLAGKKPDKVSKAMGKAAGTSIEEQFAEAARIAKEKAGK